MYNIGYYIFIFIYDFIYIMLSNDSIARVNCVDENENLSVVLF